MIYEPISDGVLLKESKLEGTSKGGIILPQIKGKMVIGRGDVVAVGPGRVTDCGREPMDLKIGDTVLYYMARAVPIDEFVLLSQQDILAVARDDGVDHTIKIEVAKKIHTIGPTLN
jgi:co-chaperonin GroES (HSP10)